jgi:hypothetical protein
MNRTCDVREFKGRCDRCTHGCAHCRIGCWNPARHKNPFFGKNFLDGDDGYWWRACFPYAEYLCARCYDWIINDAREMEDAMRDHLGTKFVENPEFTKLLENA